MFRTTAPFAQVMWVAVLFVGFASGAAAQSPKKPKAAAAPPVVVRQPQTKTAPGIGGVAGAVAVVPRVGNLPQVTYGEPTPSVRKVLTTEKLARVDLQTVTARVRGRDVSAQILHLNGRQGIRSSNLPDGARRLLEMHVRKLPVNASQYYLVNPQLAAQWAATHPVPAEVKPKDANENNSDCGTISINGVVDCAEDAGQAIEDEYERARKQADDWWKESTGKLAQQWNEALDCFSDHTLAGPTTPVKFSIAPQMTVDVEQSGSKGVAQGTVKGSLTLSFPMESDFQAGMEFSYVPCLPFVFRPKRITADGSLTVGQQLAVEVTATGSFAKTFTIPPAGGPQIVLYVIPIVIGDVPVAVLDVSAYIEGEVEVKGEGQATGRFAVTNSHRSTFDFECSGQGCSGQQKGNTAPTTMNESAKIQGQLSVQPGIYMALQLSFDYNVLQARAGPQPYLLGIANGCAAAVAMQSSDGSASSGTNAALTVDLDWGVKLRAEALAGGKRIGKRWETKAMNDRHIWYKDMAPGGSSALIATVTGPAQTVAAQPSAIRVRMPTCYPYTSNVNYLVTWSGGAIPAPNAACQWQAGTGTCWFDPAKELALGLTWQNPGAHSISVQLVKDQHRTFSPAPPAGQLNVTVIISTGGGAP